MGLILITNSQVLNVAKNEDGTLTLTRRDGAPAKGAGMLINNLGGVDAVLARCIEHPEGAAGHIAQAEAKRNAQQAVKASAQQAEAERLRELAAMPSPSTEELREMLLIISRSAPHDGWAMVGYLTTGPLSDAIEARIGGFTATPYDDGSIVVKSKAGKWSNSRRTPNRQGELTHLLG